MPLFINNGDVFGVKSDVVVNPIYENTGIGTDLTHKLFSGDYANEIIEPLSHIAGEAFLTGGLSSGYQHIVHTIVPQWQGGAANEYKVLEACYINSLAKAVGVGAETVAIPLLASGKNGFPKSEILRFAHSAVRKYLLSVDDDPIVYICISDENDYELNSMVSVFKYIRSHIKEDEDSDSIFRMVTHIPSDTGGSGRLSVDEIYAYVEDTKCDSFYDRLHEAIGKTKNMTDAQCYKKANVMKQTFNKIKKGETVPKKETAIALVMPLCLSLDETNELIKFAGYTLCDNSVFDLVIKYCILNKCYDVDEVNTILYAFNQPLLGCRGK